MIFHDCILKGSDLVQRAFPVTGLEENKDAACEFYLQNGFVLILKEATDPVNNLN